MSDTAIEGVPTIKVPVHGTTRWLRTRLGADGEVMRWHIPVALLGLIPLWWREVVIPLERIRSVKVGLRVMPTRLIVGAVVAAVPPFFTPAAVWIPVLVIGVWSALTSFNFRIVAHADGGGAAASVCYGHTPDAEMYAYVVEDMAEQARENAGG